MEKGNRRKKKQKRGLINSLNGENACCSGKRGKWGLLTVRVNTDSERLREENTACDQFYVF